MYFTFIWFHGQLVFHKQKKIEKSFPCSSQLAHFPGKGSPLACAGGRPGEPISPSLMILTCWSHTPGLLPDTLRDAIPTVNTKNLGTVGEASGRCHLASAGQEKPSSRADRSTWESKYCEALTHEHKLVGSRLVIIFTIGFSIVLWLLLPSKEFLSCVGVFREWELLKDRESPYVLLSLLSLNPLASDNVTSK